MEQQNISEKTEIILAEIKVYTAQARLSFAELQLAVLRKEQEKLTK